MNDIVPAARKPHLFAKGQSGNPAGRPKGSKNAISLIKMQLEGELRAQMRPQMQSVIAELIRQALPVTKVDKDTGEVVVVRDGNMDAIKTLYTSWVSKTVAAEDETPRERIQIVIGKLDQVPDIKGRTIVQPPKSTEE